MELFDQANKLHLEGKYVEAEKLYDMLLTQNPDNVGLLAMFGSMLLRTEKIGQAISMLHRAAEKNLTLPKAKRSAQGDLLSNLAIGYRYAGLIEKSREIFTLAAEKDPTADTLANYAALFLNVGTPEEAVKQARRSIAMDKNCAMAHWNLAVGLLELGEWATAWDEHEWGFKAKLRIDRGTTLRLHGEKRLFPQWDGTPGKTVWVYGEQGLGDEIMFASMLPEMMKTNTVILECHKRLVTLFQKAFPGLVCYGTREDTQIPWINDHAIDYQVSLGSLGKFYRRSAESFPGTPYLKADPSPHGQKMRVGISWTGGLKAGRVATRAVPLNWWRSILDNDCEFVSLQYTADCEAEIESVNRLGYKIVQHPAAKAQDYYETAKAVKSCDLVISVCTSIVHLAGALGVPTWCMVPNKPAWRYGVRGPMRWYRAVRLYRQPAGDSDAWRPVVERVGLDLSDMIDSRKEKAA